LATRAAARTPARLPSTHSFVTCDYPGAIIDTLKPAEDGRGIIVRLYESHGASGPVTLTFAAAPRSVAAVNLLEEPAPEAGAALDLTHRGRTVRLALKPFQIVTLRIR
jgi:alpha-mannosidase